MSQKLTLPIDNAKMTAGYNAPAYFKRWGYKHPAWDMTSYDNVRQLKSLGKMRVTHCGLDGTTPNQRMGNVVCGVFPDVQFHNGMVMSLACRMFHLDKIYCKVGDVLEKGEHFADYGNTGSLSTGAHLHIEFDTDINYPNYSCTVGGSGKIIKRGTINSHIEPDRFLYLDEFQRLRTPADFITEGWLNESELELPTIWNDEDLRDEIIRNLKLEIATIKGANLNYKTAITEISKIISDIK